MWEDILDNISNQFSTVSVRCMSSHSEEEGKELPEGVSRFDVEASELADEYVGEAATRAELPNSAIRQPIYYLKLIVSIQKRLTTFLLNLPAREIVKKTKTDKPNHKIYFVSNRLTCKVCCNSYSASDPACRQWLKGHCTAFVDEAPHCRHIKIQNDVNIHLGNRHLHSSHNVYSHRGLSYWLKCGAVCTDQLRYLAKPCVPPSKTGSITIHSIPAGKKPAGSAEWPDEQ